ncbi:MAG: hypothetical protein KME23_10995 [Goleter apudmare HA4340-LM2]|jgi:hypothetical protein|nr:hypothetical protein [Goleter apudmare HA4340-LM2]
MLTIEVHQIFNLVLARTLFNYELRRRVAASRRVLRISNYLVSLTEKYLQGGILRFFPLIVF